MAMSVITRKIIQTAAAAGAVGPYSQAVCVNNTLYVSGQLGLDPKTMDFVSQDVEDQTRQALKNMGEILKAAGCTYKNVVKTTVLLHNMDDFVKVNNVYKEFFTDHYPARAAYQVARLPKDGKVEIEAIAAVGEIKDE